MKFQFLIASLLLTVGCVNRTFNQVYSEENETFTLSHQTFGFSWHSRDGSSHSEFINKTTSQSDKNKTITRHTDLEGNRWGYGLYLATDPLQSMMYGDTLECVAIKAQTSFFRGMWSLDAIKSDIALIVYEYLGGWFDSEKSLAAVLRSSSVLDLEEGATLATEGWQRLPEPLAAKDIQLAETTLAAGHLCAAIKPFEKHWSTFVAASEASGLGLSLLHRLLLQSAEVESVPGLLPANMGLVNSYQDEINHLREVSLSGDFSRKSLIKLAAQLLFMTDSYNSYPNKPKVAAVAALYQITGVTEKLLEAQDLLELRDKVRKEFQARILIATKPLFREIAFLKKYASALKAKSLMTP